MSIGAFTADDVMLTMRPNLRAIMPSTVALISSIGVSMFASSARIQASRSQSRKSPGGGPPALLTRMSGCGHAASAAARPSGVVMSHATHATRRPARAPISSAARSHVGCGARDDRHVARLRARAPPRSRARVPCSRRRPARACRRCRDPSAVSWRQARTRDASCAARCTTRARSRRSEAARRPTKNISRRQRRGRASGRTTPARASRPRRVPSRRNRRRAPPRPCGVASAHDQVARGSGRADARSRSRRTSAAAARERRRRVATSTSSVRADAAARSPRRDRDASVRAARKPPATMPAVPPSRYAVTAEVASASGTPKPALSAAGRNVCSPTDAVVWTTK